MLTTTMTGYSPSQDELSAAFDARLFAFLSAKSEALPEARPLIQGVVDLIEAGGKGLRPKFCYWAFRLAGGEHSGEIVAASAALELLQAFALIHDDIMDATPQRRGRPALHAVEGPSFALLAGDLALVLADAQLLTSGFPGDRLFPALEAYGRMREEVIAGQFLDMELAEADEVTEEAARRVAVLKSGRYSVEEPLQIGSLLAGAGDAERRALEAFGAPLGEAFQLRDDLLGTFGSASELGKPVDSDVREGKRHLLYARTVAKLRGPERDRFVAAWGGGAEMTEAQISEVRSAIETSGARADVEALVESLAAEALEALGMCPGVTEAKAALFDLARSAVDRVT